MDHYLEYETPGINNDVQSKPGPKSKRLCHEPQDIPWTATRCNRLLRTIASRISILQKLASSNRLHVRNDSPPERKASHTSEDTAPGARAADLETKPSPSKDPEWLPRPAKDNAARTYGGKCRAKRTGIKSKGNVTRPSNDGLGITTPFVKRMLRHDHMPSSSSDSELRPHSKATSTGPERKKTRHPPIKPTSVAEEAYNSLITALGSFLWATRPAESRSGARSLMSACLRKVPAYVDFEQHVEDEDDDDRSEDGDLASEIYSELEARGPAGSGWHGLKHVVRADGLWKIRDAVAKNLLPDRIIEALVNVCAGYEAIMECQLLLQDMLETRRESKDRALAKLFVFGEEQDCNAWVLRTLCNMLRRGKLALEDLSKHRRLWHCVFNSVMDDTARREGVEFLQVYVRAACRDKSACADGVPEDVTGVEDSLRSVAILLTAMAVSSSRREGDIVDGHFTLGDAVQRVAASAVIDCGDTGLASAEGKTCAFVSPLLASSLILDVDPRASDSILQLFQPKDLIDRLTQASSREDGTAAKPGTSCAENTFISDVALCIGRWDARAGDDFLADTVSAILRKSDTVSARRAEVLKGLAMNSAMVYAEVRDDKASIAFAEEIEDMVLHGARPDAQQTPAARPKEDRYRWEEGLCEWVVRTPFVAAAAKSGLRQRRSVGGAAMEVRVAKPGIKPLLRTMSKTLAPGKHLAQLQQRRTKRPLSEIQDEAYGDRPAVLSSERLKPFPSSQADMTETETSTSTVASMDDFDELAFSAKKQKKKLTQARKGGRVGGAKSGIGRRCRAETLKRASSDSSAWPACDTSDDELGM